MLKPYQVNASRAILIFDSHQNILWAKEIFEREKGNYDHIITGGDEFDSYKKFPEVAGIKETAQFVISLQEGAYGPITQLIGNHNIAYMECWAANSRYSHKHHIYNGHSGFTNSKSIEINKIFKWENWRKYQLFCEFGGYLISHAGFHPSYWNFYKTKEENLDALWDEADDALRAVSIKPSRFFGCGQVRGGQLSYGSPIWLDWEEEFVDNLELPPQIVGHTQAENTIRRIGRSYCIDGAQTTYALLSNDGKIEFKTTDPTGKYFFREGTFGTRAL